MPVKPHPNRFQVPPVITMGVLALLAAILVVADPASAQSDTAACVAGGAVSDAANSPGLVSDCDTMLAARDTLAGSATLNWSVSTPSISGKASP